MLSISAKSPLNPNVTLEDLSLGRTLQTSNSFIKGNIKVRNGVDPKLKCLTADHFAIGFNYPSLYQHLILKLSLCNFNIFLFKC